MNLSIVIVAYNSSNYILNCIESAIQNFGLKDLKFIVVNNDPEDVNIKTILEKIDVRVTLLNEDNVGFGKANNKAAGYSDSEYLLFLNPDIIVKENFVNFIIDFISRETGIGACAPMLLYENGKYQNSTGFKYGILYDILESLFLLGLLRKICGLYYSITKTASIEVGWVSAACLLIKRSVFDIAGGFDSNIFLNYEDIDLCKKLNEKGYRNYFFPSLQCTHLDHKSFDNNFEKLIYTRYQSKRYLSMKYYNSFEAFISTFVNVYGILLRYLITFLLFNDSAAAHKRNGYKKSLMLYINGS